MVCQIRDHIVRDKRFYSALTVEEFWASLLSDVMITAALVVSPGTPNQVVAMTRWPFEGK